MEKKILQIINKTSAKDILLYLPLEKEVNTTHLINTLRAKKNIYVPFMEGVSFKMVKFRLPLFKKRFNIKEPKNSFRKISRLDLAIVPVLGVDGVLKRVGFGKGMYDRFFESLPCNPMIIFVQLNECTTREKLCDSYDVQANLYLSPKKNIIQRGQNDNRIKYSRGRGNYQRYGRVHCRQKIRCGKL
jgi:5-formyltetrahydrofolate cyclo-ligase